jgi:hypothetical protein
LGFLHECVDKQDYNDGAQNDHPIGNLNARYRCFPAKPFHNFPPIAAPRNTPSEIIDKLHREINLALSDSRITLRIADLGDTPLSLSTSEFAKLFVDETEKWGKHQTGVGPAAKKLR